MTSLLNPYALCIQQDIYTHTLDKRKGGGGGVNEIKKRRRP